MRNGQPPPMVPSRGSTTPLAFVSRGLCKHIAAYCLTTRSKLSKVKNWVPSAGSHLAADDVLCTHNFRSAVRAAWICI